MEATQVVMEVLVDLEVIRMDIPMVVDIMSILLAEHFTLTIEEEYLED